jgi:hypothetical protein
VGNFACIVKLAESARGKERSDEEENSRGPHD